MIASIDRVGLKLADCLSITESALDTLVQCRPPSDPALLEAAQETPGVMALPFRLSNVATTYQDALRDKFADQVGDVHPLADQPPPAVNMLHVSRRPGASLQTILEENSNSESRALWRQSPKPPLHNLLSHPSMEAQSSTLVLIAPLRMGNQGGTRRSRQ